MSRAGTAWYGIQSHKGQFFATLVFRSDVALTQSNEAKQLANAGSTAPAEGVNYSRVLLGLLKPNPFLPLHKITSQESSPSPPGNPNTGKPGNVTEAWHRLQERGKVPQPEVWLSAFLVSHVTEMGEKIIIISTTACRVPTVCIYLVLSSESGYFDLRALFYLHGVLASSFRPYHLQVKKEFQMGPPQCSYSSFLSISSASFSSFLIWKHQEQSTVTNKGWKFSFFSQSQIFIRFKVF